MDNDTVALGEEALDELFHYGTKGMKWGVRRAEKAAGNHRQAADRNRRIAEGTASKQDKRKASLTDGVIARNKNVSAKLARAHDKKADKIEGRLAKKAPAVRKDKGHEGERVKTKQLDKLDKQWEKENTGERGWIKAHNAMADRMNNGEIDKHNNDPRWKDVDLADPKNAALEKTYMDEFFKRSDEVFHEESVKLGMNPSGTKQFEMRADADGNKYAYLAPVKKGEVKHAEGDTEVVLKINRDSNGLITSLTETTLELKHYGVKGMKWGVTTVDKASQPTLTREKQTRIMNTKDVTVTQRKAGTYVKARGGQRQKATDDAVKAHAARQKAKKSTTDALTNDELKAANERMKLEQNYHQLNAKTKRRGESFIAQLFMSPASRALANDVRKQINAASASGS